MQIQMQNSNARDIAMNLPYYHTHDNAFSALMLLV